MYREHEYYLRRAIEVSRKSRKAGNTPFGALLVDADGEIVMEHLQALDAVAYVRFASVYREFKDVSTFMEELKKFMEP